MASAHLEALQARRLELDGRIVEEMHRPHPDSTRLTELKRQKLRLKDEILRQS